MNKNEKSNELIIRIISDTCQLVLIFLLTKREK